MKHVFWLIQGEICGRPGPNSEPWKATELREAGIGAVLSVNNGDSVYLDELRPAGIVHKCVPLAASAPPMPGELELCAARLPLAYSFTISQVEKGIPVLVHCRHGKDRTGLFMAYYLKQRLGVTSEEAIESVKAKRPIAFTAQGWDDFALEVLKTC